MARHRMKQDDQSAPLSGLGVIATFVIMAMLLKRLFGGGDGPGGFVGGGDGG